jgi:hypothetical protein
MDHLVSGEKSNKRVERVEASTFFSLDFLGEEKSSHLINANRFPLSSSSSDCECESPRSLNPLNTPSPTPHHNSYGRASILLCLVSSELSSG